MERQSKISEPEDTSYLKELKKCVLCEWRCNVNRLSGERGVCRIGLPEVASSTLHPAPPASFDAFIVGCSFRCVFCQNWRISTYPDNSSSRAVEGFYKPEEWAELAISNLNSPNAKMIGADRMFFTGGEPTCSLPWIEEVVRKAREIDPSMKVNYDTNGFLTEKSLKRVLEFTTSITFDIKAFNEETFRSLTGAPPDPVLRNAEYVGKKAKEKLWEFRIMVIPGVHEDEVPDICDFIVGVDPSLPVRFLAFRPNFVMESHQGTSKDLMELCVEEARKVGLEDVGWSGSTGINGEIPQFNRIASWYAREKGCIQEIRDCGGCEVMDNCRIKRYTPKRST